MDHTQTISAIELHVSGLALADMPELTRRLASLKKVREGIAARKEQITKPQREALAAARDLFRPVETKLKEADEALRRQILVLQQKSERAQDRIAARVHAGSLSVDDSLALMAPTAKGLFREVSRLKIVAKSKVPDKYWVIDEVALRVDLMAGRKVPGALLVKEKVVVSR